MSGGGGAVTRGCTFVVCRGSVVFGQSLRDNDKRFSLYCTYASPFCPSLIQVRVSLSCRSPMYRIAGSDPPLSQTIHGIRFHDSDFTSFNYLVILQRILFPSGERWSIGNENADIRVEGGDRKGEDARISAVPTTGRHVVCPILLIGFMKSYHADEWRRKSKIGISLQHGWAETIVCVFLFHALVRSICQSLSYEFLN